MDAMADAEKAKEESEAPDTSGMKRKRDTELVVPICYGTCAYYLGKKADEYHSHKWTVYLREPEHGDLARHQQGGVQPPPLLQGARANAGEASLRGDGDGMGRVRDWSHRALRRRRRGEGRGPRRATQAPPTRWSRPGKPDKSQAKRRW